MQLASHGSDGKPRKTKRNTLNFKEIDARGLTAAESILRSWLPDGRREGNEFVARNPTRADRKPGSFKFNLKTGVWTDFATGEKGGIGLISLRAMLDGSSQSEAAQVLADVLGIYPAIERAPEPEPGLTLEDYASAKKLPVEELKKLGLKTTGSKRSILRVPYYKRDGSLLRSRLRYSMSGSRKVGWDKSDSTAICLYGLDKLPPAGCPVLLVEGESDCHTLWHHGYDAIGVPGAKTYNPERDDQELDGYAITAILEPDEGGEALTQRLSLSRHRASIKVMRLDGYKDASEVHLGGTADFNSVIDAGIAAAEPLEAVLLRWPELDKAHSTASPVALTEIDIIAGERARITDQTLAVIQRYGALYERGGELVRLCRDKVLPVDEFWLADWMSRHISFQKWKAQGTNLVRVSADPPGWLPKVINAKTGERELPDLAGVITAPTLRPDGSLISEVGFDAATGLLLRPCQWPHIPETPGRAEMETAWSTLWHPFAEFPYASDNDRGVTAAAILTALVRRTLPRSPAFSFDAPAAGSGKTLLATCVAELAGGEIAVIPECREEEELRKRLLSALREGQPSILLDNIKGQFQSSALEAFLTDDHYADRLLGASQMLRLPTNVVMLISGNNFIPRGDLWRRMVTARIDPRIEHAERRCFDVNARQHCREHRLTLVAAGLTLLRGFVAAGRPRSTPDRLASFEDWDDLIRQCIIWLGQNGIAALGDPAASIARAKEMEPERQKLGAFLETVRAVMGADDEGERWRTGDIIQRANTSATGDLAAQAMRDVLMEIAGERNSINPRVLGRWIERHTDNRCGGLYVERAGERQRAVLWRIRAAGD